MSSDSNINMNNFEKLLENIPDNVKDMFSSLMSNNESKSLDIKPKEDLGGMEMLLTMKRLLDRVNNNADSRIDLMRALTPFLRPSRQEKVLQCVKAIRLSHFFKEASIITTSQKQKEEKDG